MSKAQYPDYVGGDARQAGSYCLSVAGGVSNGTRRLTARGRRLGAGR